MAATPPFVRTNNGPRDLALFNFQTDQMKISYFSLITRMINVRVMDGASVIKQMHGMIE